jgi:hypothetical protein
VEELKKLRETVRELKETNSVQSHELSNLDDLKEQVGANSRWINRAIGAAIIINIILGFALTYLS